jgi:tetratricopeptide (TPR) repeat protein
MTGECYRKQGLITTAMEKFSRLAKNSIQEDTTVKAVYAIGLIYSDNGKIDDAEETFRKLGENPSYAELSERSLANIEQYKAAGKKSPVAAGFLAIVPGLGHLYCERPGDALVSFLVNGLFAWGAVESFSQEQYVLGGILSFFELGWYMGNIHSAVGSAYKHNRYQEKMFLDRLEKDADPTFSPDTSTSSLIISFDIPF